MFDMRPGVTDMSVRVQQIHQMGLWVCIVVGIVVFGAMFYSMFAHHRSRNPTPASFSDSALVEFIWTLIPVLILVGMAIPATNALRDIENNDNSDMRDRKTIGARHVSSGIRNKSGNAGKTVASLFGLGDELRVVIR